jgi:hypothetical protein
MLTHGVRLVKLRWGEPSSRFAGAVEALAIAWLKGASQKAVGASWDEIHGIMERAVKRGLRPERAEDFRTQAEIHPSDLLSIARPQTSPQQSINRARATSFPTAFASRLNRQPYSIPNYYRIHDPPDLREILKRYHYLKTVRNIS